MAVDTNSKAYQSLQKSGYTDEQINQMHQSVASGQSAQSVVQNTQGGNRNLPGYDPMADLTPEYLAKMDMNKQIANANQSYSQYGDDSSPENQQKTLGGLNDKYTGEGVKTSDVNYKSNFTTNDLNPNFVYGQKSKVYGTDHPYYISQRNDDIASALYNEGRVSKEEVRKFLEAQEGFFDSSEADRNNTVEAVWKRLGAIAEQNKQEEPEEPAPEEPRPEMDLGKEDGGVIYGRASGDEGVKINTETDPNSPDAISLRARQNNFQSLQRMDSHDIALSLSAGNSIYGEQAMRDLSQYDPQKYQEVQTELRRIQQGETVNAIASGENVSITDQLNKADDVVSDGINKWTDSNSSERTRDQVQDQLMGKLASSQTANSATQEMLNIKKDIAELEEKMTNLPNEAKKVFKGDVPQYIIDAYVANNTQRIQSELNKLQSRYNGAIELYKTELAQKQREVEMDLKERQYNFDVNQAMWERSFKATQQAWENDYKTKSLLLSGVKTDNNGNPYIVHADGTYEYLTNAEYERLALQQQQQIQEGLNSLNTTRKDGMDGGQCEAFSDTWNNKVYGQTMLPIDTNGNVISGRAFTYSREKDQYVNTAIPKPGVTAIFDYSGISTYSKNAQLYGHTMIVTAYDPATGMITMKGSNKDGSEKVYTSTMSLQDFNTKYHGAGFWDPTQPTWFQQEQSGAVDTATTQNSMNDLYGTLITNAGTQGTKDVLSTAQTMYNTLLDLKNDGSLEELISTTDFQKWLKDNAQKSYKADDGGSEFANLLRSFAYNKSLSTNAKKALNRLQLLVEMKLRNESGAAISSSEWMTNFQNMIPSTFQDKEVMRNVLQNWDIVIKRYSVSGGMKRNEYQPIFDEQRAQREIFAG